MCVFYENFVSLTKESTRGRADLDTLGRMIYLTNFYLVKDMYSLYSASILHI